MKTPRKGSCFKRRLGPYFFKSLQDLNYLFLCSLMFPITYKKPNYIHFHFASVHLKIFKLTNIRKARLNLRNKRFHFH